MTNHILIIDDDPEFCELLTISLSRSGLSIHSSHNGEDALEQIAADTPNMVFLDLDMPRLDGFGVVEALQENPKTRTIPVVVTTNHNISDNDKLRLASVRKIISKVKFRIADIRVLVSQLTSKEETSNSTSLEQLDDYYDLTGNEDTNTSGVDRKINMVF